MMLECADITDIDVAATCISHVYFP